LSPLFIGGLEVLFTPGVAATAIGGVGIVGAGLLICYAKETLDNLSTGN